MIVDVKGKRFLLDLPQRYTNSGCPNPDYLNTIYNLLEMPNRVSMCDVVLPEHTNAILEKLGSSYRVFFGDDIDPSYDKLEFLVREWLKSHGT